MKIYVRNENEMRIISVKNLLAVNVDDYLCTFFVENEPDFTCTKSLKETIAMLPDFFIRINRNCIVNANKIESIKLKQKEVLMPGNRLFPFSVNHEKALKEHLQTNTLKNVKLE
jgi:DNA-binding LytR/AlgR family response regulator